MGFSYGESNYKVLGITQIRSGITEKYKIDMLVNEVANQVILEYNDPELLSILEEIKQEKKGILEDGAGNLSNAKAIEEETPNERLTAPARKVIIVLALLVCILVPEIKYFVPGFGQMDTVQHTLTTLWQISKILIPYEIIAYTGISHIKKRDFNDSDYGKMLKQKREYESEIELIESLEKHIIALSRDQKDENNLFYGGKEMKKLDNLKLLITGKATTEEEARVLNERKQARIKRLQSKKGKLDRKFDYYYSADFPEKALEDKTKGVVLVKNVYNGLITYETESLRTSLSTFGLYQSEADRLGFENIKNEYICTLNSNNKHANKLKRYEKLKYAVEASLYLRYLQAKVNRLRSKRLGQKEELLQSELPVKTYEKTFRS